MKHILTKFVTVAFVGLTILFGVAFSLTSSTYAEDNQEQETEAQKPGTSISISPVSRIFQLNASSTYEDVLKVTNDGSYVINFEVYAAPYSYVYSEENDTYSLGFTLAVGIVLSHRDPWWNSPGMGSAGGTGPPQRPMVSVRLLFPP